MAGIVGLQDLWIVGSRAYFQRSNTTNLVPLGIVDTVNPSIEPTKLELREFEYGVGRLFDTTISEFSETYEITTHNFFRDNISNLFMSSDPVTRSNPSESGSNIAIFRLSYDSSRHAVGSQFIAIDNGGANPTNQVCYNVSAVSSSVGNMVVEDSARGIIKLSSVSGMVTGAAYNFTVSLLTPLANNRQVMRPQTATLSRVTGEMFLYYERNNGDTQSCRNFRCALTPSGANFQIEDYSDFSFNAKVLYDATATAKFGKFITYRGSVI